jgi:hypothetical protein
MLKPSKSFHDFSLNATYILTISAGALIVLTLLIMWVLFPGGSPDPFAPYEVIMPGESARALDMFACIQDYPPSSQGTYVCRGPSGDELIFSRIQVLVLDGTVKQITFYGESLQVVDLIHHFGQPESITLEKRHYVLTWDDGTYAFIPISARRFAHQLRVLFITLRL